MNWTGDLDMKKKKTFFLAHKLNGTITFLEKCYQ